MGWKFTKDNFKPIKCLENFRSIPQFNTHSSLRSSNCTVKKNYHPSICSERTNLSKRLINARKFPSFATYQLQKFTNELRTKRRQEMEKYNRRQNMLKIASFWTRILNVRRELDRHLRLEYAHCKLS